ncbi:uncharacterized protein (DUF58 family) [Salisediminibacterium halotolerans]|nr:uncharacterized protein (DUF58 family) [Actinophytocola xinjiangensis]RPE86902.1 uncharacterized protein (DUF58 family) [Salisediminibacterium halotolerans]TWG32965.1 uncharacterized protein (DUF58 family) [Salisediminibacterium halotolerans]
MMIKPKFRIASLLFQLKRVFKLLLFIAVLAGLYSYAMFQGGFVSWFLFYSVTTLMILMILYAAVPLGALTVERDAGNDALPAGTDVQVTLTIRRKIPFPFLYLAVEDKMESRLQNQTPANSTRIIFYPGFKRTLQFTYEIPAVKRGEYQFLGTYFATSDFFGMFRKRKFISQPALLLVFPGYYELNHWSVFEKTAEETSRSRQEFVEDRTSIAGAREYVPGDKLTSIDWKVTARSGKLMTKEFEEHTDQQFMILLNNQLREQSFAQEEAYERGIELAASFVMHCYKHQLKVGLTTLDAQGDYFSIDAGEKQQTKLIKHLAQIEPQQPSDSLPSLFRDGPFSAGGEIILFISAELTDAVIEQVNRLHQRRLSIYFFIAERESGLNEKEEAGLKGLRQSGVEVYRLAPGAPVFRQNDREKGRVE